jgi:CRP-like cAMP-binding protein
MFDILKEVGPQQIFGEVVLIQPKARTTTAVCLDDYTELLCLSFDTYTRIIEKAIKKDLYVRTHFLQQFRIFSHMTQS